ncbi:MAG: tRNA pseudouridine(38-40) synthase TruA [Pseudomonadota bacterium]|nr:tRNA pseudouridine(38-40) synthase TruA [Pseudomonadota bacterium]
MRIAAGVEYDGSAFCGWQYQDHSPNVQAVVEKALGKVANHPVRVVCAGRTDTGVHAAGQVIHFDTDAERSEFSWVRGTNSNLPASVRLLWTREVEETFHARFKAQRRYYRYVIFNRAIHSACLHKRVSWEYRPLELHPMQQAAKHLLGEHDFSAYRAVACQAKSPVRTLYQLDLRQQGPFIILDLSANAFLHHMVRNIAGVLMRIGAGEAEPDWARQVLELRDRTLGGVTAPPDGLYFTRVDYPGEFELPGRADSAGPGGVFDFFSAI